MKFNLENKRFFLFVFILLVTFIIGKHFYNVYTIILNEKSSDRYEKNIYSDTRLSRTSSVERTPPHLIFNHSGVLAAGIKAIGVSGKPYFRSSAEDQLELQVADEYTGLFSEFGNVVPFFGRKLGRIFYNGFSYDSKIVVPQVDRTMQELIGRRGRINYRDGSFSKDVFILEVEDGYVKITGSILHHNHPVSLELYKIPPRSNFTVPIEKISFLPFIEDGVGKLSGPSMAIRLKHNESILRGDVVEINGKAKLVTGVLDGPGAVKFLLTDSSGYLPYIDTRQGTVNVAPKNHEKIPSLFLPIRKLTNDDFYNGQQRHLLIETDKKFQGGVNSAIITISGKSIEAKYISDGIFLFDHGEGSSTDRLSSSKKSEAAIVNQIQDLIKKSKKIPNINITVFGFDANRKNIPILVSYKAAEKSHLLSTNSLTLDKKIWMGEQLWSTYTGLINQYYNTFNPSGFEYIIHALGPENRGIYRDKFMDLSPEYVQTSVRNFDFTDFHGWSLTNSWDFYRLLLASYVPVNAADYAQIWKRASDKVIQPKVSLIRHSAHFPLSVAVPKSDSTCNEIRISEIKIDYELKNNLRFMPLIGKTPRLIVYVNDGLSALPISLPPDQNIWIFPIAYVNGQSPVIDIKVHSPILPSPELSIRRVEIRDLEVPQDRLRALFLPASVKNFDLCVLTGR